MDNPRPEKVAIVAEVREKLDGAEAVLVTEYRGLNVHDLAELRGALTAAGGEYKIYKNTMVRFAAAELDLEIEELLVGPTALALTATRPDGSAGDPVSIARAITDFAKGNDNLLIKGGLLEGRSLSLEEIAALSKIAPREELLSRLAGGMAAPMQQFAALLNAINSKFAYALEALIDAGGAPGAPESVVPEAEDAPEEAAAETAAEEAPEEAAAETAAPDEAAEPEAEESPDEASADAESVETGTEESEDVVEDPASDDADQSADSGESKES